MSLRTARESFSRFNYSGNTHKRMVMTGAEARAQQAVKLVERFVEKGKTHFHDDWADRYASAVREAGVVEL